ncbi:hypothetical protein GPA19_24845 [Azoarcus indigens]|nr:hypothetical protein [Azoarcus indigens]NMG68161.1 hypothetical protein [Azoarcus indigens]
MKTHLFVGGLVAAGFDPSGQYLLTVSHAGRGVFSIGSWQRVARDTELAYPEDGHALGIGPMEGVMIPVSELNYDTGQLRFASPDGKYSFEYGEGTITVTEVDAQPCGQPDLAQKAAQGRVP